MIPGSHEGRGRPKAISCCLLQLCDILCSHPARKPVGRGLCLGRGALQAIRSWSNRAGNVLPCVLPTVPITKMFTAEDTARSDAPHDVQRLYPLATSD